MQVDGQKNDINEEVVNAISDLLNYSTKQVIGAELERLRQTKLQALEVISKNWDKKKMIEYIWAAIKDEADPVIKKRLISFIIQKRELKAFPRLFRFCQIGAIPNELQRMIGSNFVEYYDACKDSEDMLEDLEHAINVLGKTLVAEKTESLPLATSILTRYSATSIIRKILTFNIKPKILRELVWVIARNEIGVVALYDNAPNIPSVDSVLLELAHALLFPYETRNGRFRKPNKAVIVDLSSERTWSVFPDLPPVLQYLVRKTRNVHSSENIRLTAMKLLSRTQKMAIDHLYRRIQELSRDDFVLIDDILGNDLYFDAIELPIIVPKALQRIFAEKKFHGILDKFNFDDMSISEVDASDIDIEVIRMLEREQLAKEVPFIETRMELAEKTDDMELKELLLEFMDDHDYSVLKEFLDSIEYSLLTILEHHKLLSATVEQMQKGFELGKEAILNAYFSINLPESFWKEARSPSSIHRYLSVDVVRQTILNVAQTTSSINLRQKAFEMLSHPDFWIQDNFLVATKETIVQTTRTMFHFLNIEQSRKTQEILFSFSNLFLDFLQSHVVAAPEVGENGYPLPKNIIINALKENEDQINHLKDHHLGFTLFLRYHYLVDGHYLKIPERSSYPQITISPLVRHYLSGLSHQDAYSSMKFLLSKSADAKLEFLSIVDKAIKDTNTLLSLNLNSIRSILEEMLSEMDTTGIKAKAKFLLKKIDNI